MKMVKFSYKNDFLFTWGKFTPSVQAGVPNIHIIGDFVAGLDIGEG
jgi:hypothetical protein